MKTTTVKKKALNAKQGGTVWLVDPRDLTRVTDPTSPVFDPTVHDPPPPWMLRSMRKHGFDQTQVLVVRKNGVKDDGSDNLEIVDGRSRHAAATIVADELEASVGPEGRLRIPVVLAKAKNEAELADIMLRTRYLKKRIDVITQAEQVFDYLNKFGKTHTEASEIFKLSEKTIRNYEVLVQLTDEVKDAVRSGKLSAHDAIETFADMSAEKQRAAIENVLASSPRRQLEEGEEADEDEMTGGADTGGGSGTGGGKGGKKGGKKGKKELSPVARLRLIFRSPDAMDALSKRERTMFDWVFAKATLSELAAVHPALAEAVEKARKKGKGEGKKASKATDQAAA